MNASVEGRLHVRLKTHTRRSCRCTEAQIRNQRLLAASRLLEGKTPQQALDLISLLFTLCGKAQRQAAEQALSQALNKPRNPEQTRQGELDILMETAREHVLRLMHDAPRLLGLDVKPAWLRRLQQLQQIDTGRPEDAIRQLESLLEEAIFQCPEHEWLERVDHIEALCQWIETHHSLPARCIHLLCERGWVSEGNAACPPLPSLDALTLLEKITDPGFTAQPLWQGQPHETGSLARQRQQPLIAALMDEFGNGLLTRFCARLTELAALPARMRGLLREQPGDTTHRERLPNGWGMAHVEAARGRLIHAVEVRDQRIRRYHILAPTEWNFHPDGAAARCLTQIKAGSTEELEQLARLTVHAIDPCVGYQLELA